MPENEDGELEEGDPDLDGDDKPDDWEEYAEEEKIEDAG